MFETSVIETLCLEWTLGIHVTCSLDRSLFKSTIDCRIQNVLNHKQNYAIYIPHLNINLYSAFEYNIKAMKFYVTCTVCTMKYATRVVRTQRQFCFLFFLGGRGEVTCE